MAVVPSPTLDLPAAQSHVTPRTITRQLLAHAGVHTTGPYAQHPPRTHAQHPPSTHAQPPQRTSYISRHQWLEIDLLDSTGKTSPRQSKERIFK
jgi:hypothetical protein